MSDHVSPVSLYITIFLAILLGETMVDYVSKDAFHHLPPPIEESSVIKK